MGLQAIVLTGGCTQIPLLQRLLGRAASGPLEVARFAAARGAAILAAPALSDAHRRNGAMSSTAEQAPATRVSTRGTAGPVRPAVLVSR